MKPWSGSYKAISIKKNVSSDRTDISVIASSSINEIGWKAAWKWGGVKRVARVLQKFHRGRHLQEWLWLVRSTGIKPMHPFKNMYPISQTFGKLICIAHHLNLAVEVDALMAATQIVRDKWAVSCQEERRWRWKFRFFLELLSCRQQHAHTPPMLFAGAATSQSPTVCNKSLLGMRDCGLCVHKALWHTFLRLRFKDPPKRLLWSFTVPAPSLHTQK